VGLKEQAAEYLKSYWGAMLYAGADTFWESWDGENPDASPYGGSVINSYCHAWSCTPAYIIPKYLLSKEQTE
jgi:alpha-L-rhamnosidase